MTGFEPLIGAATAGLTGLIGNVIKEKGSELLSRADINLFQGREFNQAVQKYIKRYSDRHGILKVACVRMDNPVKLDEVYTAVQLLPRSALRYYESTESLQELFRESGKRGFSFENAEKKQGIEVANAEQYLMVLGGPGVGKSTFLRKMGLEALRRQAIMHSGRQNSEFVRPQDTFYKHDCIPVMLELRQYDSDEKRIEEIIAEEFRFCGFPMAQEFTEICLKSGKLLILLDGLDEVPEENLNRAIIEVENLIDQYASEDLFASHPARMEVNINNQKKTSGNRFIASCRMAAYNFGGFRRFSDVAMAAFDDSQIRIFISNWFKKPRDLEVGTARRCWALLSSSDYQAAKELAQTPLLLTLLCVIYDEFQDLPRKRHQVYGEALDVLLRKWASEKRIQRNPIYQELSAELELDLLSEIARENFIQDRFFFEKENIIEEIRKFLVKNLNAPDHLDAEQVLREIEIQQGILVERAQSIYSFSHLTFHEYLTAKWIVNNLDIEVNQQKTALALSSTNKNFLKRLSSNLSFFKGSVRDSEKSGDLDINPNVQQLVSSYILDSRWKEIFLLLAGLMPGRKGADDLLIAMEKESQANLDSQDLSAFRDLIRWVNNKNWQSINNFSEVVINRVTVLVIALDLTIAFGLELDFDIDLKLNLDVDLDIKLARALISNPKSILACSNRLAAARTRNLLRARTRVSANARSAAINRSLVQSEPIGQKNIKDSEKLVDQVLIGNLSNKLDDALNHIEALEITSDKGRNIAYNLARNYSYTDVFQPQKVDRLLQNLELIKCQNKSGKVPIKKYWMLLNKIRGAWEELVDLNLDDLRIPTQNISFIGDYLYIIQLMISCKEAAVRVSPEVWEGIESRILTLPHPAKSIQS
ncbi:MAG: NACHT domain-containing protein [Cyanobacteria bacterium P01_D01_bin.128]